VENNISTWIQILLASSIVSAIVATFVSHIINKRFKLFEQMQEYKKTRYLALIILLYSLLKFENSIVVNNLKLHRPTITSKEHLREELECEYFSMFLYASKEMLINVRKFLDSPNNENYRNVIVSMRKDLWGLKNLEKGLNETQI